MISRKIVAFICVMFMGISTVTYAADSEVTLDTSDADSGFTVKDSVGAPVMSARGDGKVGIGTTSPTSALDVNGVIRGNAVYASASDPGVNRSTTSATPVWDNNLSVTIPVKANDVVFVTIRCNLWTTFNARGDIALELFSGAATTILSPSPIWSEIDKWESGSTFGIFQATTDGNLEFRNKVNNSAGGSTNYRDRIMAAWVLGKG